MSPSGDSPGSGADGAGMSGAESFRRLEDGVDRLLMKLEAMERELLDAEGRAREAEELVQRFTGDEAAAGRLLSRLRALEEENELLRSRLADGRDAVERLLARIRFLEDQR